jgi:DNA-binding CsgD family transcriptional regulator
MQDDLIDRIYECSVVPELWPTILDDLSRTTESRGGLLFSARKMLAWTASDTVRDVFDEYVRDGWFAQCSRRVCLMSQSAPSFFVEQDFWSPEEIDNNPIYRDFFRRHGLGWSAGTGLAMPTGDNVVFSIERTFERGPVEREYVEHLTALRPHLVRSAFVTARLGMQRAAGATETLTALGLPALVIDDGGAVIDSNPLIDDLAALVRSGAQEKVRLTDRQAQTILDDALAALRSSQPLTTRSFPLRDDSGLPVQIAHILPITRSAHDVFSSSFALLLFSPVTSKRGPTPDLLRSLFDLTPAEARVASGIARGLTLEEIAQSGEVAMTTVRTQLRKVLEKTGCTRQAEVAALLTSVNILPEVTAN